MASFSIVILIINTVMMKYIFFISIFLVFVEIVNASTYEINSKNQVDISFTDCPIEYSWSFEENIFLLNIHYRRKVIDCLSIGAYFGSGLYDEFLYSEKENTATTILHKQHLKPLNFGTSINLDILPLIMKSPLKWVDIYVKGMVGAIHLPSSIQFKPQDDGEEYIVLPTNGTYFDTSFVGGVKLYPTKRIGVFGEYGYRYFEYFKGFHSKFGIALRF